MSFASLLTHRLAVVQPVAAGDPLQASGLGEYGQPLPAAPVSRAVLGLVQPRTAREVDNTLQSGVETSDHVIFLLPQKLAAVGWIADADASGNPIPGGRRFDIVGVRSYEFGSQPHLEVDVKLVGSTEGPTVGS